MQLPPAIIFINQEMNDITINGLTVQLHLDETISFTEYNARINVDPNYPETIHANGRRVLVILPTLQDYQNRDTADIVLYFKHGQVTVEKNKFGPPGLSLPAEQINIFDLLRDMKSKFVAPPAHGHHYSGEHCGCAGWAVGRHDKGCNRQHSNYPYGCQYHTHNHHWHCNNPICHRLRGVFAMGGADTSGIYAPNPDNMYNNKNFINRK